MVKIIERLLPKDDPMFAERPTVSSVKVSRRSTPSRAEDAKMAGPRFRHGEERKTPLGRSLGARKGKSGRVTGMIYKKD